MATTKTSKPGTNGVAGHARSTHPLARCKPLGDRAVIRRDTGRSTTEGGLILPQTSVQDNQQIGTVVSVGPGRTENGKVVPMTVQPGNRVIITGYAGLSITDPGASAEAEYVILREEDILAILPD